MCISSVRFACTSLHCCCTAQPPTTATPLPASSAVSLRIYPSWVSVEPGSLAQLDCRLTCNNASICSPLPKLRWHAETGRMNPQATVDRGRLTIPSVGTEDEQYYTCTADSNRLALSTRTVILVQAKSE